MTVYLRGRIFWYVFELEGRRIQESSGFTNKTAALRVEAARRTALLERRAGVEEAKAGSEVRGICGAVPKMVGTTTPAKNVRSTLPELPDA